MSLNQTKVLETSLVLQATIEGMTPGQACIRDELVEKGVPFETATELVKNASEEMRLIVVKDQFAKKLKSKGFSETTISAFFNRLDQAVDHVIAAHPELETVDPMTEKQFHDIILLCASGNTWKDAKQEVLSGAEGVPAKTQ